MKVIGKKVWEEPAVAIGLLVTLGLLVANLIGTPDWSAQAIIAILAPLVSALGIRQVVVPEAKLDEALDKVTTPAPLVAPPPRRP